MISRRTTAAVATAVFLALAPVACDQEELPAGSGEFASDPGEPGTDPDMGPGVVPGATEGVSSS